MRGYSAQLVPKNNSLYNAHIIIIKIGVLSMPADKSVSVNGIEMFYHDEGKGQPILFLHGSLATHAVWQAYFDGKAY